MRRSLYRFVTRGSSHKRGAVGALLGALALLLLSRSQVYQHESGGRLRGVSARAVWDYVADFSNMRVLQPNLDSFHVLNESGDYGHWHYTVQYYEKPRTWLGLRTTTLAHYSVRRAADKYIVSSSHRTCYLGNYVCVRWEMELETRDEKPAGAAAAAATEAHYSEYVRYDCPAAMLFASLCRARVHQDRAQYFTRLRLQFT